MWAVLETLGIVAPRKRVRAVRIRSRRALGFGGGDVAVAQPADQAADVGGVGDVGDRGAQEEVQGRQDQELADDGVLRRERALADGEPEYPAQEPEDRPR